MAKKPSKKGKKLSKSSAAEKTAKKRGLKSTPRATAAAASVGTIKSRKTAYKDKKRKGARTDKGEPLEPQIKKRFDQSSKSAEIRGRNLAAKGSKLGAKGKVDDFEKELEYEEAEEGGEMGDEEELAGKAFESELKDKDLGEDAEEELAVEEESIEEEEEEEIEATNSEDSDPDRDALDDDDIDDTRDDFFHYSD